MTCSAASARRSLPLLALPAMALVFVAIALTANAQLAQASPLGVHAEDELPDPDGKPADMSKPVQVYVLLGQSNMLGAGKVKGDEGSLTFAVQSKGPAFGTFHFSNLNGLLFDGHVFMQYTNSSLTSHRYGHFTFGYGVHCS